MKTSDIAMLAGVLVVGALGGSALIANGQAAKKSVELSTRSGWESVPEFVVQFSECATNNENGCAAGVILNARVCAVSTDKTISDCANVRIDMNTDEQHSVALRDSVLSAFKSQKNY